MMKRLLIFVVFVCSLASAEDLYIAQTAAGSGDGSSCANALAVTFYNTSGNWGAGAGKISQGDTVHLCGTITTALAVPPISGAAGNIITILFEANSKISMPVCPSPGSGTGCITLWGKAYFVVDGGTNGIIENTLNGTAGGACPGGACTTQSASAGVDAENCDNCEVKNLTVQNIYVRTSTTDVAADQVNLNCIKGNGANFKVHDSTCHDAGWGIVGSYRAGEDMNWYNNNVYNIDHGFAIAGTTVTGGTLYFYGNHIHDYAVWDDTTGGNKYHHDGIHIFNASGATLTAVYGYNNLFDGNPGISATGHIFEEDGAGNNHWFNNILLNSVAIFQWGTTSEFYNNTFSPNQSDQNACVTFQSITSPLIKNNYFGGACNNLLLLQAAATEASSANIDYNVYANCATGNCFAWSPDVDTSTFATWRTGCGTKAGGGSCDVNSVASLGNAAGVSTTTGAVSAGSAVINAGTDLSAKAVGPMASLSFDKNGVARPNGSAWDIGAYQFAAAPGTFQAPNTIRTANTVVQ